MSPDIATVQTFLAVIDCGSVIEASRVRGYSAAAVSRQLGRLQGRLGVRLFVREGRSIRPTEAAIALALHDRRLVAEAEKFERYSQHLERAN
jgi:DNA-binding transcriptional LysR family regulator